MGQYHITVNLSRREFLDPHKLGDGLKLAEQANSTGGTMSALMVLLACSAGKGGGDVVSRQGHPDYAHYDKTHEWRYVEDSHESEFVGRWAGDSIAVIGDYTDDEDLPLHLFPAHLIYELCRASQENYTPCDDPTHGGGAPAENHADCLKVQELVKLSPFRDISDDMVPLIEKMCDAKIVGDGWRDRLEAHYIPKSSGDGTYTVWADWRAAKTCDCPQYTYRKATCKHMTAVNAKLSA